MGTDSTIKGIASANVKFDGSPLRIAVVHARWNRLVVDALLDGVLSALKEFGVQDNNIVVQSVPGSFELPLACSRMIAGSHVQATTKINDLLSGLNFGSNAPSRSATPAPATGTAPASNAPFDAVIAIGVLIKGETMHFEYISNSVTHALMKIQLETGVPVIFGVLTALTEEQALVRAGLGRGGDKGHNHGEDWGAAAVEMALHARRWREGNFA